MTLIVTFHPATTVADRDLVTFRAIHRALRRSSRALLGALRAIDYADGDETAEVRAWFDHLHPTVVRHHRVVDTVVVPALVADDPGAAVLGAALRADHAEVADHLDRVAATLDGLEGLAALGASEAGEWQLRAAITAVEGLVAAIDDQVDREGAMLLRSMVGTMSRERWEEIQGELILHGDSNLPFVFPWLVQGVTTADEDQLVMALPRMLRVVHRFVWKPAHERNYPLLVAAGHRADRTGSELVVA